MENQKEKGLDNQKLINIIMIAVVVIVLSGLAILYFSQCSDGKCPSAETFVRSLVPGHRFFSSSSISPLLQSPFWQLFSLRPADWYSVPYGEPCWLFFSNNLIIGPLYPRPAAGPGVGRFETKGKEN